MLCVLNFWMHKFSMLTNLTQRPPLPDLAWRAVLLVRHARYRALYRQLQPLFAQE